jgi:hypothetical protein
MATLAQKIINQSNNKHSTRKEDFLHVLCTVHSLLDPDKMDHKSISRPIVMYALSEYFIANYSMEYERYGAGQPYANNRLAECIEHKYILETKRSGHPYYSLNWDLINETGIDSLMFRKLRKAEARQWKEQEILGEHQSEIDAHIIELFHTEAV